MAAPATLSSAPPADPARSRLDPFRLPPATSAQFGLLAVLTLFGAAYVTDWYLGFPAVWTEAFRVCALTADGATATDVAARARAYLDCNDAVGRRRIGAAAAAMLAAAVAIALVHAAGPRLLIRRRALAPPDPGLYPDAVAEVVTLIDEARLRRTPRLLIDPFRESPAARVFGAFGRSWLRLNIGVLRGDDAASRERRRAIVRHELAHLSNRDIEITGLTVAAGRVLLPILACYLVAVLVRAPGQWLAGAGQAALFATLVLLTRGAVVRAREHYADVRAADGQVGPAAFPMAAFPERPRRTRWRLFRAISLHPPTTSRAAVVDDPTHLLRLSPQLALTVGLTAGLLFPSAELALENLLGRWPGNTARVTGLVMGLVIAVPLVAGVWRATLVAVSTGARRAAVWPSAVLLTGGLLLGGYAMPTAGTGWGSVLAARPSDALAQAFVLLAGFLLGLAWARGAALVWLSGSDGRRDRAMLRWAQSIGVLLFGTVVGAWYLGLGGTIIDAAGAVLFALPSTPLGILAMTSAAAFTVAAGLRGSAERRTRPWAALVPAAVAAVAVGVADAVLPNGLILQAALAAISSGHVDFVMAYVVLGIVLGLAGGTAAVVLVVTSRDGAGAAPFAHAVVGAATATLALEAVEIAGPMGLFCGGRACVPWNGIGMLTNALNVGAAVGAIGVLLLCGPLAVLLMRRSGRRAAPPRAPLRSRRAAVLVAAALALLGAVSLTAATQSSLQIALAIDDGATPVARARSAPDADPAGTVGVVDACRLRTMPPTLDPQSVAERTLVVHAAMAASDSSAVAAFGRTAHDIERRGGSGELARLTAAAADMYCRFLGTLALPNGPPDTAPASLFGVWAGTVTQEGSATPVTFTATVTGVEVGTPIALAVYPTLGCTAHWTLKAASSTSMTVREIVDKGPSCVDGDVPLELAPDGTWSSRNGRVRLARAPG